jgi:hypothetical protein
MYKTIATRANATDGALPLQRDGFDAAKTNYRCTLSADGLAGTAEITSITIDGTAVVIPAGSDVSKEGDVQQAIVTAGESLNYIQSDVRVFWTAAAGSDASNVTIVITGEANVTSATLGGTPTAFTVETLPAQ